MTSAHSSNVDLNNLYSAHLATLKQRADEALARNGFAPKRKPKQPGRLKQAA